MNNLEDIINYIEQNESEGEFEIYLTGGQAKTENSKAGILKSREKLPRPISRVSFGEVPMIYHDRPMKKRSIYKVKLPDTDESVFENNEVNTPAPTFTEEVEYEVIYSKENENNRRNYIDRDRINYMYDDNYNNDNIRVVYNDNPFRKMFHFGPSSSVPVLFLRHPPNVRRRSRSRRHFIY